MKGVAHMSSYICIFNGSSIQNEAVYVEFNGKTINARLPEHFSDPELFVLVKTYKAHAHSRTWWKCNKNECCFSHSCYFMEKIIFAKSVDSKISNDEEEEVLTWRNILLRQVKSCIDNNLNLSKVNLIDSTKDHFTQLLRPKKFWVI